MIFPQRWRRLRLPRVALVFCLFLLTASAITYSLIALAPAEPPLPAAPPEGKAFPIVAPTVRYELALDTLSITTDTIDNGQTLSDILLGMGLDNFQTFEAATIFDSLQDVRTLRAGKPYTVIDDPDTEGPDFMVYEPSVYRYIRLDLQGEGRDKKVERPVTVKERFASGKIESSLWNAMVGAGHSFALTDKMEDALQWSVDFYHTQVGDEFQLVYEQEYVEGGAAGLGPVRAARYRTGGKDIYAFYFVSKDSTQIGYFGLDGEPMKSSFLRAPVRYSRISSHYNLRRFHPIQRRVKPHFGTDYAAPYGTPILAVADGTISRAGRTGGNGIFVKIRHNKQYSTQYLHMQRRAPGMHVGARVSQGDVIGYVGSTGLATGPHVCFRFWQNGKQVDHTRMNFPSTEPMPADYLPEYFKVRNAYLAKLNGEDRQLVWAEEFTGENLDTTSWNYQYGTGLNNDGSGWGNNELQYYLAENTRLDTGILVIEARQDSFENQAYTSSRLTTKDKQEFTFGRIDVRAKLPIGQGIWPAVWMLGAEFPEAAGWPECGEIDVMEYLGHKPNTLFGTAHFGSDWKNHGYVGDSVKIKGTQPFHNDFHVFSIDWRRDTIEWLLDGKSFHLLTPADVGDQPWPFNDPHYFLVNLAVGGNWPGSPDASTEFPQQLLVDYIRVYQESE